MAPNLLTVSSLDLPELRPYRTLRRPMDHIKEGIFVAEGARVVQSLIASELTIVSLLLTPQRFEELRGQFLSTVHRTADIFIAEKDLLETIVGYNLHQGIMAVARVPKQQSLHSTIGFVKQPHLLVALDGLVNAENVGVVVRNCAGFGVDAVIVGETSSSPYLRRAVRNSMGAVFQLPIVHVEKLTEAMTSLRQRYGTRIIAAHPREDATIFETNLLGNICIVFGNEGEGISETVLTACSERFAIPMANGTDSLNVASASAVFLYEARKQRAAHAKS